MGIFGEKGEHKKGAEFGGGKNVTIARGCGRVIPCLGWKGGGDAKLFRIGGKGKKNGWRVLTGVQQVDGASLGGRGRQKNKRQIKEEAGTHQRREKMLPASIRKSLSSSDMRSRKGIGNNDPRRMLK